MAFVHLHTHTEYSLLDGSNKIKEYVARVKELGMTAAAITDHGVMYGVIDFYKEAKKQGIKNDIVILTATSGDTGKSAMEGFAGVPGTRILVFYPKNGVSRIQELQMLTQKGENTFVIGLEGNFDDAQTGVKKLFHDQAFAKELDAMGYQFSSANSINIGRLVPQIVYYVYAYAKLFKNGEIKEGETVNVTVLTGNFGNILAAYFAK